MGMCLNKVQRAPSRLLSPVKMQSEMVRFSAPQPPVTNLSTPCYLCDVVVRVGSMRFAVLEPPRTIAEAPYSLFPL